MIPRAPRLTPAEQAELAAEEDRRLSPEEFAARVAAPWTEQELADFHALVGWFRRRYPTAGQRLAAMRRRMVELQRSGQSGAGST